MDWYRLKDAEEAINAGMEDRLLQENAICMVEWPERAQELLPREHLQVKIDIVNDKARRLQIWSNN